MLYGCPGLWRKVLHDGRHQVGEETATFGSQAEREERLAEGRAVCRFFIFASVVRRQTSCLGLTAIVE